MKSILTDKFYSDGRGPELRKAWIRDGSFHLMAIDFFNPDDVYEIENLKHLLFLRPQAFQITPEEEFNYKERELNWSESKDSAIWDLGRTNWAKSFSMNHSSKCSHYLIMFYDEFVDILCEGVSVEKGSYKTSANHTSLTTPGAPPPSS